MNLRFLLFLSPCELLISKQKKVNLGNDLSPTFEKILLPVDESAQSRVAQQMAVFLSKAFNSQVTIMHVVPKEPVSLPEKNFALRENFEPISTATGQFPRTLKAPSVKDYALPDGVAAEVSEGYLSEGQAVVSQVALLFKQAQVSVKEKLVGGVDVAEAIIREADSGGYDLVVLGNSEGEDAKVDFHLGSVAEKVSQGVKTPVLVVREKMEVKVLAVPVDGSEKDGSALAVARALAEGVVAKVLLLHVQEKRLLRSREGEAVGLQILGDAAEKLAGLQVEQKLASGDPAKIILQAAEESGAVIVMSGGGRRTLNHFLGGVSSHVLHYAKVPVLLVK